MDILHLENTDNLFYAFYQINSTKHNTILLRKRKKERYNYYIFLEKCLQLIIKKEYYRNIFIQI